MDKSPVDMSTLIVKQPDELRVILEPIVAACALARLNALVVGDVGYGKTEIIHFMLKQIFGDDSMLFPCVPTTKAEDVIGYPNPIYSIEPDAKAKGIPYWITEGTPVDPDVKSVLLDEFTRDSEHTFGHQLRSLFPSCG